MELEGRDSAHSSVLRDKDSRISGMSKQLQTAQTVIQRQGAILLNHNLEQPEGAAVVAATIQEEQEESSGAFSASNYTAPRMPPIGDSSPAKRSTYSAASARSSGSAASTARSRAADRAQKLPTVRAATGGRSGLSSRSTFATTPAARIPTRSLRARCHCWSFSQALTAAL